MQTYIIVVRIGDSKSYVKFLDSNEQGIVFQLVPKMDASLFSGEQIEEYVPLLKEQHSTAYSHYNHNEFNIYAEKYAEVTLQ